MPKRKPVRAQSALLAPRWLIAGYFLVLAAVLASVVPTLVSTVQTLDQQQKVLDPAAAAVDNLLTGALNQETGMRGYVITGQSSFLQPFYKGTATYDSALRYLRAVASSEPNAVPRVDATDAALRQWRAIANGLIAMVASGDLSGARQTVATGTAKAAFDGFRLQQGKLRDAVGAASAANRQHLRDEVQRSLFVLLLVVAIGFGLATAMWSWWRIWGRRSLVRERELADVGVLVESVINATNEPIFAKDRQGRHILANRARVASLNRGDADADIIGSSVDGFVTPELAATIRRDEQLIMANETEVRLEEELPQPDGPHIFDTTKSPLYDAQGKVIGVVGVARDVTEERKLLLDRERLYEIEHRLATTLQRAMLGTGEIHDDRIDVCARYEPAGDELLVGGDWYDVVPLENDTVGLIVGDAVGKGIEAATAMGQMRNALAALALAGMEPAAALNALERFAEVVPGAKFGTCLFMIIDPIQEKLVYSNAGHLPPLIVNREGMVQYLESEHDLPLSVATGRTRRHSNTWSFEEGSTLVLFTDGLIERRDESLDIGFEKLANTVGKHLDLDVRQLCDSIISELVTGREQADDVALVCARLVSSVSDHFRRTIAATASAIRPLRHELADWLTQFEFGDDARAELVLAAGEAIANSVEHAYANSDPDTPVVMVDARRTDDRLVISVQDYGAWRYSPPDPRRGRGLTLMRRLVDVVDIRAAPWGTLVRLEVPLDHRDRPSAR